MRRAGKAPTAAAWLALILVCAHVMDCGAFNFTTASPTSTAAPNTTMTPTTTVAPTTVAPTTPAPTTLPPTTVQPTPPPPWCNPLQEAVILGELFNTSTLVMMEMEQIMHAGESGRISEIGNFNGAVGGGTESKPANPYCNLTGVHCNSEGCVEQIKMPNAHLHGTIPKAFGDLSFLEVVIMPYNELSGHLPSELGKLQRLKVIDLESNALTGSIPAQFGTLHNLTIFNMTNNKLSKPLPASFSNLTRLHSLIVSVNNISGPIPDLRRVPLYYLDLSSNSIEPNNGSMPLPPSIRELRLTSNLFTGSFPPAIIEMKDLIQLDLSYNSFTGNIPSNLSNLALQEVDLSHNKFGGHVPDLSQYKALKILDLSWNSFTGTLPDNIFTTLSKDMSSIDLSQNLLLGTIPRFTENYDLNFVNLCCQVPGFSGDIPSSLSAVTDLEFLDLSNNRLNDTLANVVALRSHPISTINLSNNKIQGDFALLDDLFGSKARETAAAVNLRVLDLSNNNITGTISQNLCQADQLMYFDVGTNALRGVIPDCMANFEFLRVADFDENDMQGPKAADGTIQMPRFLSIDEGLVIRSGEHNFSCPGWLSGNGAQFSIDPNYYSYQWCSCNPGHFGVSGTCYPCVEGAHCLGGTIYTIEDGGWFSPSPYNVSSMGLVECPFVSLLDNPCEQITVNISYPESYGTTNFPCQNGYSDRLCSRCDPGFFRKGRMCIRCHKYFSWLLPLVYIVGVMALMYFALRQSGTGASPESIINIVIFHVQAVSLMKDVEVIDWSVPLYYFFDYMSWSNFEVYASQCVFQGISYEMSYISAMLTPLLFVAFATLMFLGGSIWHQMAPSRLSFKARMRKWVFRCIYVLLFFLNMNYINVTHQVLMILDCVDDPNVGRSFLSSRPYIECSTSIHTKLVNSAYVVLPIYVVGVPVLFLAILVRYRHQLHMPHVYSTLGFAYSSFKPRYYWWELVVFLRRFALMAALFLAPTHTYLCPLLVFLVLQFSIMAQIAIRPYNTYTQNFAEAMSLYTLEATFLAGLVVQIPWVAETGGDPLCGIILFFNLCVLIYFVYALATKSTRHRNFRDLAAFAREFCQQRCSERGRKKRSSEYAVNQSTHAMANPSVPRDFESDTTDDEDDSLLNRDHGIDDDGYASFPSVVGNHQPNSFY